MKNLKKYEEYELSWMASHGYSVQSIFNFVREYFVEKALEGTLDSDMNLACDELEEYFKERGFNGEMYACYNEFLENEGEEPSKTHLIISNNSECDDLSVYRYDGSKKDAYKRMQAMVMATAANIDEECYMEVNMNSSEMEAGIQLSESHESFRVVSLDDITNIEEADGVAIANFDSFPDDIHWDNESSHYVLHDVGRED